MYPIQLLLALILVAGMILITVFFLLNLQNTLKEISPSNRSSAPANVWLMFIPLFNYIYPFILYPGICDSIKKEYNTRGRREAGDFGRGIAIALPILGLCAIIPYLGILAALANLILFIVFWVKIAEFKNNLKAMPKTNFHTSNNPDILD